MAQQTINVGTAPNDGTGTPLRTAFQYTNSNFSELYTALGGGSGLPGASTQVLFNNGTNIAGDAGLVYNSTTDALTIGGNVQAASATITGDLTVDTSTLKVDSANNRVGIGTATPAEALTVAGKIRSVSSTFGLSDVIAETTAGTGTGYARLIVKTADREWRLINDASTSGSPFIIYDATANAESLRIATAGVYTFGDGAGGTRMTLNSTGLGVGASPATRLHIQNTGDVYARIATTSVSKAGVQFSANGVVRSHLLYDDGAGTTYLTTGTSFGGSGQALAIQSGTSLSIYTNNQLATAQMTLDASGRLLVGTTDSGSNSGIGLKAAYSATAPYFATVGSSNASNTYSYLLYSTTDAAFKFYVSYSGQISATSGTISAISDARLKENVQDIDVGLGAILALKPRKFDWKAGKGKDIKGDRGFIAQEFEQVFPNLIDEWKDPAPEGEAPYKSVRQDLIPVLVKAIQELAAEVNALKNA